MKSEQDIAEFCARHGFVNFHGGTLEVNGVHIAGLGYSSPTPFNTPGEYSEEELASRLAKFAESEAAGADLPRAAARIRRSTASMKDCTQGAARCASLSKSISRAIFSAATSMRPRASWNRWARRAR